MAEDERKTSNKNFTRSDGHQSPILMKKKAEKDEDFYTRMTKYGWAGLDKPSGHWRPESNEYHFGKDADCPRCAKGKKSALKDAAIAKPKDEFLKDDVKKPDVKISPSPSDPKKVEGKVSKLEKDDLGKIDSIEEKSEHTISNDEAKKLAKKDAKVVKDAISKAKKDSKAKADAEKSTKSK